MTIVKNSEKADERGREREKEGERSIKMDRGR